MAQQGDLKVGVDFTEVEKAEAAVDKLGKTSNKTKTEVRGLGSSFDGFKNAGGPIGDAINKFEEMKDRVGGATDGIRGLTSAFGSASLAIGVTVVALGALAAAAAAGVLYKLGKEAIAAADEFDDLSERTNIATERLSLYAELAKLGNTSIQELTASAEKLAMKLSKQDEESGKVVQGLKALGVSTKDANGETKSMLQLQEDVVVAVDKAKDSAAAEGAAVQVLGTDYYKLRAAIKVTLEKKSEMYDYMQNTGAIVTADLGKKSGDLNDKIDKMGIAFKGMGNSVATTAMPYLQSFLDKLIEISAYVASLVRKWTGNMTALEGTAEGLSKAATEKAAAEAAIAKLEGSEYAKTGAGAKALAQQKERLASLQETTRELNRYKTAATEAAKAEKDIALNGAVGEGIRPGGKAAKPEKAKKDNTAEKEAKEQLTLMERFAALSQKQVDDLDKAKGIDSERNKLQRDGMEILAGVKGLTGEQRELAVQTVLAEYDKAKLAEKEKKSQEEITKERQKQLDSMNELILKSNEYISKQKGEFADRFLSKTERAARESERGAVGSYDAAILKTQQQLNTDTTLTDEKREGMRQFIAQMQTARGEALGAIQALNEEKATAENSLTEGMARGFRTYADSIPTIAQQTADAVTSISQSMEDAFVQFTTTGKFNIKSLASTVIAEFARMQAKAAVSGILKFVGGIIGGSTGTETGITGTTLSFGSGASSTSLFGGKYADGGNPPMGKVSLVGERGPELFIPKTQGTIIPNNALGGSNVVQNFNLGDIYVQGGNTNEETATALNREMVKTMQGIAKQQIMQEQRPGGLLRA
jgi:lambda family phage tail tape measure protein